LCIQYNNNVITKRHHHIKTTYEAVWELGKRPFPKLGIGMKFCLKCIFVLGFCFNLANGKYVNMETDLITHFIVICEIHVGPNNSDL
jgi:hypothetical protein